MTDIDWEGFRARMPVAERWAYFDHAAVAPLSGPALDAMKNWAEDVAHNGDVNWGRWQKRIEETRRLAAELIRAETSEIALIRNTTEGISLIAEGYPWQAGDNVVVPESEFPSNLYPWMNLRDRGVEVRKVPVENERLDPNRLAERVDDRTRIVAVSWVGYATGWRNDLDELAAIAHSRNSLLFVDAIQGLGILPLDVTRTPIDCLAADGHKWMLGPEGAGLLFIRRKLLDELRPLGIGWNSVQHAGDFSQTDFRLKPSAGRYEGGSYCVGNLVALGASLEMLLRVGMHQLANRLGSITDQLCDRISDIGAEIVSCREVGRKSGIVAFRLPGVDSFAIRRKCLARSVVVNCRGGAVRLSPHVYTNDTDIEQLMGVLSQVAGCRS